LKHYKGQVIGFDLGKYERGGTRTGSGIEEGEGGKDVNLFDTTSGTLRKLKFVSSQTN
jgi:hypothetical protein